MTTLKSVLSLVVVSSLALWAAPTASAQVILDVASTSGVTITGTWTQSTANSGYYGPYYLQDGDTGGGKSVTFTPTLSAGGLYQVYGWWTSGGNRATNATFNIFASGSNNVVKVNQQTGGGGWVSLGTFNFTGAGGEYAQISDTGANGYVIADAVEFVPMGTLAATANSFLASTGVNTHISQGYSESSYEPLLEYLGVRNVRDGNISNPATYVTLHNNTGVLLDIISGGTQSAVVSTGTALAASKALLSFEGPNEPNNQPVTYNGQRGGGSLPGGLSVNTTNGQITGTLTAGTGTYTNGISASNSTGIDQAILTTVSNPVAGVPVISSAAEAAGTTSSAFSYTITASGSPTSFSATSLPSGLVVNSTTGAITGTITAATGVYDVPISATNGTGTGKATLAIAVNPTAGAPIITSPAELVGNSGSAITPYTIAGTNTPTGYMAASWVPVAYYQRDLFTAITGNSVLSAYPVFGVSEEGAENDNVGLQWSPIPSGATTVLPVGTQFFDYANVHNYISHRSYIANAAWLNADPSMNQSYDGMYGEYTGVTWNKHFTAYSTSDTTVPRVTTETGWGTADTGTATEDEQGKLFLNAYLSEFKRGFAYCFIYELVDNQGGTYNGGFYTGASQSDAKLSANYVHNLTTILADTANFQPASLNYSIPIEGSVPTVHDLLLQKTSSTGNFYLVVWDEREITDPTTDSVVVNLGGTFTTVNVFDPTVGTTSTQSFSSVSSVTLSMKDHPLILQLIH
jgi:hypothetical protein